MKKFAICFALSILYFSACDKDEQNLPEFINALIAKNTDCTCNPFINEYEWQNRVVYVLSCNGPACDCFASYYDENGQPIKMDSGYFFINFTDSAKLIKYVWSCHN